MTDDILRALRAVERRRCITLLEHAHELIQQAQSHLGQLGTDDTIIAPQLMYMLQQCDLTVEYLGRDVDELPRQLVDREITQDEVDGWIDQLGDFPKRS